MKLFFDVAATGTDLGRIGADLTYPAFPLSLYTSQENIQRVTYPYQMQGCKDIYADMSLQSKYRL